MFLYEDNEDWVQGMGWGVNVGGFDYENNNAPKDGEDHFDDDDDEDDDADDHSEHDYSGLPKKPSKRQTSAAIIPNRRASSTNCRVRCPRRSS
jgi:hypothetical protein